MRHKKFELRVSFNKLWKKLRSIVIRNVDQVSIANLIAQTFCFKLCEDFCTLGIENGLYKVLVVKRKKNTKRSK